jgi:hypothetical protein
MVDFVEDRNLSLVDRIVEALKNDLPLLLVGGPGLGKSQRIQQAADILDAIHVDVRLSLYDPVDVKGLPYIQQQVQGQLEQQVRWAMPDFIARTKTGRKVILNYEEINCASASTMNTALQLILDKRAGEHILGGNVSQVACVNRAEHRAHVNPMSAPLINRFMVLSVEPNLDEWMRWAMTHDIHEAVIGYLNYRAEALYQEPKNVADEFSNFPSPRSWERVSKLVHKGIGDFIYFKGCIGEGAAVEFSAYLRDRNDMPNIDDLLAGEIVWNPAKDKTKLSVVYAVVSCVADRCIRNHDLIEATARHVLLSTQPEIAALFMSMLFNSSVKNVMRLITASKGLIAWLKKHQKLISRSIALAA